MKVVNYQILIAFVFTMLSVLPSEAQCPVFTNLNGNGVTCQYGTTSNPFMHTGIVTGRHTVINQQGTDPRTGGHLPLLPPGETTVIKLGNERTGAEAEAITYTFTVDPDNAILLLKFAVVFQDPGHPSPAQPRFVVRVLNAAGQLVESCAKYDVTAAGNIPGFSSYGGVRYRPWTNVGIDLFSYAGQTVKVQFITYDCSYHGHYGYAYFTASCISNNLALSACNGDQITLVAPSGFASYHWDNGSTSPSAVYTIQGNTTVNCLITSATGCHFTLSGTISSNEGLPTQSMVIYDTIGQGDSYNQNYFNLPPQNETGTFMYHTTFFNTADCSGGEISITLYLTVLQYYHFFHDAVCQGMDYNEHGFHYTNLQAGHYVDTVVVQSSNGYSINVLSLTVNPSFSLSNTSLSGNTVLCKNSEAIYSLPNPEGIETFYWNVPEGVSVISGQGTSSVNLYFTDLAPNPAIVSLTGANGCGSGTIQIAISNYPTYHIFFQDSLCTGNEYHQYGFDLPRQDSTGWFTFMNHFLTENGCDSVRVLQLMVTGSPSLSTLAMPQEICEGQQTTIHALGEHAGFNTNTLLPTVAVGDILCTDGSVVKKTDWPCGKTAKGIVFYVDSTREHGWAVHLQDQASNIKWSLTNNDIALLNNYANARVAISDFNGSFNTQIIRNGGNASTYPAAYAVDYSEGWYLPSAGQLRILFSELVPVNSSLSLVGGNQIPMNTNWWYWSSTEHNASTVWTINYYGFTNFFNKNTEDYSSKVRGVRSF